MGAVPPLQLVRAPPGKLWCKRGEGVTNRRYCTLPQRGILTLVLASSGVSGWNLKGWNLDPENVPGTVDSWQHGNLMSSNSCFPRASPVLTSLPGLSSILVEFKLLPGLVTRATSRY